MKTLQIFNVYQQYGGEENVVRSLSALMAGPDWRDVFFHSREWASEPWFKKLTQPLRAYYNAPALQAVESAQRQHQADVWLLHNVLPVGSLALYHKAAALGVPLIQYLHNYRPFSPCGAAWHNGRILDQGLRRNFWPEIAAGTYRSSRLQTLFISLMLKAYFRGGAFEAVTTWLSQSAFQKARYVAAGIPAESIEVLLPPRTLEPAPEAWTDEGYLLFLGRLVPEKGIVFLLEQWEAARQIGVARPRLVIAGTGPLEAHVRQRAAGLPDVSFVGHVGPEERRRLLGGCSAVVVPSQWWEVLGLVVFEAYEMEKPVLAARIGGLGEIVESGRTGFQFEAGDGAGLDEAIRTLLACSLEQRHHLGQNGRRWLIQHTDPGAWVERYHQIAHRTMLRKQRGAQALNAPLNAPVFHH